MRHTRYGAELVADAMAGAPLDTTKARRGQPDRELAFEPRIHVARLLQIPAQRSTEEGQPVETGRIRHRLGLSRADRFNGVIDRAHAG